MSRTVPKNDGWSRLNDMHKRLASLERSSQLDNSSITNGSLTVFDADRVARVVVGKFSDDDFGIQLSDPNGNVQELLPTVSEFHGGPFIAASAGYVAPAGTPIVEAWIGASGNAVITVSSQIETTVSGDSGFVGVSVDGTTALDIAQLGLGSGVITGSAAAVLRASDFFGPLSPGSHTFQLQYRCTSTHNVGFSFNFLEVRPF